MATCIHCGVESASPFIGEGEPYCSDRCYERSVELKTSYRLLDSAYRSTIEVLVTALDARECETNRHSQRVAGYSRFMGERMGLSGEDLDTIERGALLHDIGKSGMPDAILLKPDKLNEDEWRVMRTHPTPFILVEFIGF